MQADSFWQLCVAFLKTYFGNPIILLLLLMLVMGVGVSLRFRRIEGEGRK